MDRLLQIAPHDVLDLQDHLDLGQQYLHLDLAEASWFENDDKSSVEELWNRPGTWQNSRSSRQDKSAVGQLPSVGLWLEGHREMI
jgi:hypothetical protein